MTTSDFSAKYFAEYSAIALDLGTMSIKAGSNQVFLGHVLHFKIFSTLNIQKKEIK